MARVSADEIVDSQLGNFLDQIVYCVVTYTGRSGTPRYFKTANAAIDYANSEVYELGDVPARSKNLEVWLRRVERGGSSWRVEISSSAVIWGTVYGMDYDEPGPTYDFKSEEFRVIDSVDELGYIKERIARTAEDNANPNAITSIKKIGSGGGSLHIAITTEAAALGLDRGDFVRVTLERL